MPAYSVEAAAVITALPNAFFAGTQLPLKITLRSSTLNSERTILLDLCLRHGKYARVAGAKAVPPAAAKVITDVTAQVMAAHVTLITGDTNRHIKVTPQR